MRKVQRILMLIAAIVSIVCGIIFAGIIIPTTLAVIARNESGDAGLTASGIYLLIVACAMIINIFLSFFGKNTKSPVILVLNIIFGILSDIWINAVGAIFGFIANSQEK